MAKKGLSLDKLHVLDVCAQIEDKNAELYHLFADYFAYEINVQKLWRGTGRGKSRQPDQNGRTNERRCCQQCLH